MWRKEFMPSYEAADYWLNWGGWLTGALAEVDHCPNVFREQSCVLESLYLRSFQKSLLLYCLYKFFIMDGTSDHEISNSDAYIYVHSAQRINTNWGSKRVPRPWPLTMVSAALMAMRPADTHLKQVQARINSCESWKRPLESHCDRR